MYIQFLFINFQFFDITILGRSNFEIVGDLNIYILATIYT